VGFNQTGCTEGGQANANRCFTTPGKTCWWWLPHTSHSVMTTLQEVGSKGRCLVACPRHCPEIHFRQLTLFVLPRVKIGYARATALLEFTAQILQSL